jgi:hypothetical protein
MILSRIFARIEESLLCKSIKPFSAIIIGLQSIRADSDFGVAFTPAVPAWDEEYLKSYSH